MIDIKMPRITKSIRINDINMSPEYGGVYYMFNEHRHLIYIGNSKCLRRRMFQHQRGTAFFTKVEYIKFFRADREVERELYETYAINKHKPYYNKAKVYDDESTQKLQDEYVMVSEELQDVRDEIRAIREMKRVYAFGTDFYYGVARYEWPGDLDELEMLQLGQTLWEDCGIDGLRARRTQLENRLKQLSFYAN